MKRKKLLLITAISPFPQDSGGATRIKNTIQELSTYFDISLISFKNQDYNLTKSEKNNLNKWCKKVFFVPLEPKKSGTFIDFGQPYWFSDWYSPELINIVNCVLKEDNFDLIQIEFTQLLYLIDYIKKTKNQKIFFTSHDVSTISFFRRWLEVKNIKAKIVHFFRFIEIYLYEKKYLPKYSRVISVSKNDEKIINKLFKIKNTITVANGLEKVEFLPPKNKNNEITLGYIGSFSHSPNKTAFIYFLKKIAPILEEEKINYKYLLAGKNDNNEILKILTKVPLSINKKIINIGFVPTPKDFFKKIDILITPILSGSGSRIKILEALGYGKKIISSSVGAEGIEINTKLISIANNPTEYVDEIKRYLSEERKMYLNQEKINISKLTWKHLFNSVNSYY